ncbi:MAG TPA: hypothetical protein VE153_38650, partial [Myxococcus sp.]|nr:hypothetical protein [Myxococcus sp.]
ARSPLMAIKLRGALTRAPSDGHQLAGSPGHQQRCAATTAAWFSEERVGLPPNRSTILLSASSGKPAWNPSNWKMC